MKSFDELFDKSPLAFALCEMDGTLLRVNKAYADLIGRSVEETLSLSYWHITPIKFEARETIQVEKLKKRGRYGPYQKEYLHKDGTLIPVSLSGWIINSDGKQLILSVVENLREEFAHLAYVGLALCDRSSILAVNQYFAEMLGFSIGEILQRTVWDFMPDSLKGQEERLWKELREKKYLEPYNKNFKSHSNETIGVWLVGRYLDLNGDEFVWLVIQKGIFAGELCDYFLPTTPADLPQAIGDINLPIRKNNA